MTVLGFHCYKVHTLLTVVTSLDAEHRLERTGLVVVANRLCRFVARRIFLDQTCVSCIARQILYY